MEALNAMVQPPHSKWLVGLCAIAIFTLTLGVNGLYMLVSPRAWYRLPRWFRASAGLSEEKYGHGWGAAQIRVVGAAYLGVIVWMIYYVFSKYS